MRHEMQLDEVRSRGCDFSSGDLESFLNMLQRYDAESGYHLEVLLTIKHLDKSNTVNDGRSHPNLFEFSVGNCKCFLRAQVFSKDNNNALLYENTVLKCDYLDKNSHLEAEFGRVSPKVGKKRMLEYKSV